MQNNRDEQAEEKLEYAKDQVIGAIAETMDLYGVAPAAGKLYATMYFEGQMNLDDMHEQLGMSKPSMSTNVRKLQDNGMVKKVFQRGSRKHTYTAEKDFFRSFMSFYRGMWEREANMNLEAIEEAEKDLTEVLESADVSNEVLEKAQTYYDMITQSKVYYHWLQRLAESIQNGDIFEFLPKHPSDDS